MPQLDSRTRRTPPARAGLADRPGSSIDHQSIPLPPDHPALGAFQHDDQGALVGYIIGTYLERGLTGPIAAVVERLAVLTLESLYLCQLDDVCDRIRKLADDLTTFADTLDHKVAA